MSYSRFLMPMTIFDVKEPAIGLPAILYIGVSNPKPNPDLNPKPNPNR